MISVVSWDSAISQNLSLECISIWRATCNEFLRKMKYSVVSGRQGRRDFAECEPIVPLSVEGGTLAGQGGTLTRAGFRRDGTPAGRNHAGRHRSGAGTWQGRKPAGRQGRDPSKGRTSAGGDPSGAGRHLGGAPLGIHPHPPAPRA